MVNWNTRMRKYLPLQRSREACRKREKDERGKGSKNIRSVQKTRKGLEPKGVRQFRTTQPRARQKATHMQATCRATRSNRTWRGSGLSSPGSLRANLVVRNWSHRAVPENSNEWSLLRWLAQEPSVSQLCHSLSMLSVDDSWLILRN